MKRGGSISIWFFIGISLLVNGILIFGAGVYQLVLPAAATELVLFQSARRCLVGRVLADLYGRRCIAFTVTHLAKAALERF